MPHLSDTGGDIALFPNWTQMKWLGKVCNCLRLNRAGEWCAKVKPQDKMEYKLRHHRSYLLMAIIFISFGSALTRGMLLHFFENVYYL